MPAVPCAPADPYSGDGVLREALRYLNRAWSVRPPRAGFGCVRALFRIDGTMYFDFQWQGGAARGDWIGERGGRGRPRPVIEIEGSSAKETMHDRIRTDLRRWIENLIRHDAFHLLRYYNRDREELRFGSDIVDILLAGRFVPDRTAWFDWRFSGCRQERAGEFEILFASRRGPLRFAVTAPGERPPTGAEVAFAGKFFSLSLVEDCRTREERSQVPHQVERFVGFLLNRAVHEGMRLVREAATPAVGSPSGTAGREPISTSRFGNPCQWHQFFSDFEIQRAGICGMRFTDPIAWITHGEGECTHVEPTAFPRPVFYANMPWIAEPTPHEPGSISLFTNLGEEAAIHGGSEKIERAVEQAVQARSVRFVCVNNTCMPKIIGDDVASVIRRHQERSAVPILSMNTDLSSPEATFANMLSQASRVTTRPRKRCSTGQGLNLVGFPPTRCRREIQDALASLGIRVNTWFLPEIGLRGLAEYRHGSHSVVFPARFWLELAGKALEPLGIPCHFPPAPFGWSGSLRWYQEVARCMGSKADANRILNRPEQRREFAARAAAAREFSLAVVVSMDELARLTDPSVLYGVPLIPMLDEMGFSIEVLLLGTSDDAVAARQTLATAFDGVRSLSVSHFEDAKQLASLLRKSPSSAVYSEVFFDRRLTAAGKSQFHLSMFEPGLAGALRTQRRLIDLCRWPFYRRYGGFLSRQPFEAP